MSKCGKSEDGCWCVAQSSLLTHYIQNHQLPAGVFFNSLQVFHKFVQKQKNCEVIQWCCVVFLSRRPRRPSVRLFITLLFILLLLTSLHFIFCRLSALLLSSVPPFLFFPPFSLFSCSWCCGSGDTSVFFPPTRLRKMRWHWWSCLSPPFFFLPP